MKYVIWTTSFVCALAIMVLVWTDHLAVAAVAFMVSMALLVGLRLLEHPQKGLSVGRPKSPATGGPPREA